MRIVDNALQRAAAVPQDVPEFLVQRDTSAIYISTGLNRGNWIPVSESSGGGAAAFATLTGDPYDNANLAAALNAIVAESNDAMIFKGVIDCLANPNYPAAERGNTYKVSGAGKIGGASGVPVEVGDLIICLFDATPAGDQAAVGADWTIVQSNIDGAVTGPVSSTDDFVPQWNGTTGRFLKAGVALAEFFRSTVAGQVAALTGKTTPVDADVTLIEDSAASNAKKKLTWANVKATLKTYFDTLYQATLGYTPVAGPASAADSHVPQFDGTSGKLLKDGFAATAAATASTLMSRDGNANTAVNNVSRGFESTPVTGGIVKTLTVASPWAQFFTGSGGSVELKLPIVSTLPQTGFSFLVANKMSSEAIIVESSAADQITSLQPGEWGLFECILLTGTSAASWSGLAVRIYNGVVNGQQLFDGAAILAFDAGLRQLIANDGSTTAVDWSDPAFGVRFFGASDTKIDPSGRLATALIKDQSGATAAGLDERTLYDPSGVRIEWAAGKMYGSDGTTVNFNFQDPNGSTGNFKDDASTPTIGIIGGALAVAPAGYIKITVGGVDSWLPYYQ